MYVPENVVTNDDLARRINTNDEWIRSRSGIRERHLVGEEEHTSTMATRAGQAALNKAGLPADELDLLIVATSSPDYLTPPVSSQVQDALGARCGAFQMVVGCTGFVYALVTAQQFISTGAYRNILIIGAELTSRWIDWEDRATCVLFGDGAGAVVFQATEILCGVRSFVLGSDGSGARHLIVPGGGVAVPPSRESVDAGLNHVRMNGREVFKFATRKMTEALDEVLGKADLTVDDLDLFIPHQANLRIIEFAAKKAGLPMDKVMVNVDRYGNTSAASVPLALCEALDAGRAGPGDKLALVAFGAGLTWAGAIVELARASAV